eukprot:COSAG06_NODE_1208_length_10261_cov_5.380634_10_plen_96_part_00
MRRPEWVPRTPRLGRLWRLRQMHRHVTLLARDILRENGSLFLELSLCVCPEPVLVKCSFLSIKWLKKTEFAYQEQLVECARPRVSLGQEAAQSEE